MKKGLKISFVFLTALLLTVVNSAKAAYFNYYNPRISIWGLGGQQDQVRGDLLIPLFGDQNNLFYTDLQGSYTRANNSNEGNYGSVGAGFRKLQGNGVYGVYLFLDRDETQLRNVFNVLSPGLEAFFQDWDFRVNGYFPVSDRSKTVSFFPSQQGCGDCGESCGNCQFVTFAGHQQFENRFTDLEKAGPGGDTEVGYTFHRLHNAQLHAGVYYFNFNNNNNSFRNNNNTNSITGVEGRLEVPVNPTWAVTVESSYDNYQHGTVMGGLRFNLFAPRATNPRDSSFHMLDAIPRNLGSLQTGSGIPTVKATRNDGLFLTRDNIYFFTSQGGSVFVNSTESGTFENPLRNDQFSQSVVNTVGNNANFYFNPGTYTIMGVGTIPNAEISLLSGDSIYGRNFGYRCSAIGDARPTLLGSMSLPGYNTLASIQLEDKSVGSFNQLTALDIENAKNVFICNCRIDATTEVIGDNTGDNFATGIYANNSTVKITTSTISANALIDGNNANGHNFATAIGSNNSNALVAKNFSGNVFSISNSTLLGFAKIALSNELPPSPVTTTQNSASGIGTNASLATAKFTGNIFNVINSTIGGIASIGGDNDNFNFASGIGGNTFGGVVDFTNNIFNLEGSEILGHANVGVDNTNFINSATGIGSNVRAEDDIIPSPGSITATGDFISNTFNITNSNINISAAAKVGGDNNALNFAAGIGGNANATAVNSRAVASANFSNNTFKIINSVISGLAQASDNNFANFATGIGGNARARSFVITSNGVATVTANFTNNNFYIAASTVQGLAHVRADNSFLNYATGIGGNGSARSSSASVPVTSADVEFANNIFTVLNSSISSTASVGTNASNNFAAGIGGNTFENGNATVIASFENNKLNIVNTNINASGIINGDNSGTNFVAGIGGNSIGNGTADFKTNSINVSDGSLNVFANIGGNNSVTGINQAFLINMNGGGNIFLANQILANVEATVGNSNAGANRVIGLNAGQITDSITISPDSIINMLAQVGAGSTGSNTATPKMGSGTIIAPDSIFHVTVIG